MPAGHLITRTTILGTGLIGGSFSLALRRYVPDMHITGWDRPGAIERAAQLGALDAKFSGALAPALEGADLIYVALPIAATLDLLPEIARHAPAHALVTDACSTKLKVLHAAAGLFPQERGPVFVGGHPMAGKELAGAAHAAADLFRGNPYALIGQKESPRGPRVAAFVKIIEKIGARPLWLTAEQHDSAVGLASHLPQMLAIALGSFLYERIDENGLPVTLAGPGLRDSLRLAGSSYSTWRDIILTNQEVLSAALDVFARRIDDLREHLGSRELESEFDSANELYKLLRDLK